MSGQEPGRNEVEAALDELTSEGARPAAVARALRVLASSARAAGAQAVASGAWLADLAVEVAPRIPVRDPATLQAQFGGRSGSALAAELVGTASRATAATGAAAGALVGAQVLAPPLWVTVPVELAAETLAVAAIEMKLLVELHGVFGRLLPADPAERNLAVVRAWAERRAVPAAGFSERPGMARFLGRRARTQVISLARRRLLARLARNLTSLGPLFTGAVAGAELNRRATRALGEAVVRDLTAPA